MRSDSLMPPPLPQSLTFGAYTLLQAPSKNSFLLNSIMIPQYLLEPEDLVDQAPLGSPVVAASDALVVVVFERSAPVVR